MAHYYGIGGVFMVYDTAGVHLGTFFSEKWAKFVVNAINGVDQ